MTIQEAAKLYALQKEKISGVDENIHIIKEIINPDVINRSVYFDPITMSSVVKIRSDILLKIGEQLLDYKKHLLAVLDEPFTKDSE
jgi:hypothetical protein